MHLVLVFLILLKQSKINVKMFKRKKVVKKYNISYSILYILFGCYSIWQQFSQSKGYLQIYMLVPPYFCKTYTRVNIQICSKNLKFSKKCSKNVASFLHKSVKKITLFPPLFQLKWIITHQHIFDTEMYTNWQKTPIIYISSEV